jgi:hypothetical protein
MDTLKNALTKSVTSMMNSFSEAVPKIIMLLILLLIGWIVARVIRTVVAKALKVVNLQKGLDKMELTPMLVKVGISDVAKFMSKLAYWFIMIIVMITAAETVQLDMISSGLASLISYMPKLFAALVILLIGMFVANAIKKVVYTATDSIGLSGAQVISNIVYYVLFIFVVVTAINQTGIDTDLITSNITMVFAAILVAFAISYGFASKDIMTNMLSSFYTKDRYKVGMQVKVGDVSGTIVKLDNLSLTVQADDRKIVIPVKHLISERIEILND